MWISVHNPETNLPHFLELCYCIHTSANVARGATPPREICPCRGV